jgi:hypothetical protein
MEKELLKLVKNYLGYTWVDEETEQKLKTFIKNTIAYLDEKSGIKNDYTKEGRAQTLLLNRVAYENSGVLDEFENNYKSMIIAFINKASVMKYVENQKQSDE